MLAFIATPALAQEAPERADDPDDNVIMVTANKREQSLQETPLAITAVTEDTIELLNITETADLGAIAPNVAVNGGTTNTTSAIVTIRGIPTNVDEALGYDSPIGLYIDGVYLARSAAASFEIAEIERIEVLRGPQGTLFGRNTTGGAINYITSRPSYDASAELRLGAGNYDRRYLRGVVNSGDLGGIRASVGMLLKSRDGIVDNLLEPDDSRDPGSNETAGFRAAVEIDLGENLTFYNVFDWTDIEGTPYAAQLSGVGDGAFRPNITVDGNEFSQVQPAPVGQYLANSTILEPGCGDPLDSVSTSRLDSLCLAGALPSEDTVWGNMTRLELELGNVTVRSTTAFRWWRNEVNGTNLSGLGTLQGPLFDTSTLFNGFAGTAAEPLLPFVFPMGTPQFIIDFVANSPVPTTNQPLFLSENTRGQDQFTQEIEIIGGSGTSFEWVLGGFYFDEHGFESNDQTFAFVLDTNQAVFSNFGPLSPAFQASNPARYRAVAQSSTLAYTVDAQSYALYGQGTWRPGGPDGRLGITVGARYTWDEKSVERTQNGAMPFSTAEGIALNTQEESFSEPTGHVTLDYRASDDVNLYARFARGYRSGGFNVRQATNLDNPATPNIDESVPLIPFTEEKINSWEVGAKTQFGPLRFNAAAFYNVYSDLQSTVLIPSEGGGSFGVQLINAGEVEYLGVELEALLQVTDALTLDAAVGYVDKNIVQFPSNDINGDIQNIASISRVTNSPDTTANAAITWSDYIGSGDTRLTARVGWNYTSENIYFSNPLTSAFVDETSADERHLFSAQLRLDGLSLGNGAEFFVQLWGKNILDEEYVSRGIDYGQLGYGQIIFGDPATYGFDIGIEF
ncbi:TonB-dependent receptor [Erythrobacter alti]|uniref:TonB-dependent receptor n=1 Tax=Erythrobacter alti TaxID=1896145 RepID=UPI0030F45BE5